MILLIFLHWIITWFLIPRYSITYSALSFFQHISSGFLLPNWPMYLQVFCAYLMHPASTVRQTTSIIFKFLGEDYLIPFLSTKLITTSDVMQIILIIAGMECKYRHLSSDSISLDQVSFTVAKDSSNPAVLKLVLRGLSSGWSPNTDHLLQNLDSKHTLTSNQESFSSFNLCAKAEGKR